MLLVTNVAYVVTPLSASTASSIRERREVLEALSPRCRYFIRLVIGHVTDMILGALA